MKKINVKLNVKSAAVGILFVISFAIGLAFNYFHYANQINYEAYQQSGIIKAVSRHDRLQGDFNKLSHRTDDLNNQLSSLNHKKSEDTGPDDVLDDLLEQSSKSVSMMRAFLGFFVFVLIVPITFLLYLLFFKFLRR